MHYITSIYLNKYLSFPPALWLIALLIHLLSFLWVNLLISPCVSTNLLGTAQFFFQSLGISLKAHFFFSLELFLNLRFCFSLFKNVSQPSSWSSWLSFRAVFSFISLFLILLKFILIFYWSISCKDCWRKNVLKSEIFEYLQVLNIFILPSP